MPRYLTAADLRAQVTGGLNERVSLEKRAAEASVAHSVFLSHSSKDAEHVPGAIALLERHGARVYIDKKDSSLPLVTDTVTAEKLRQRIKDCRKFVILTSENSKDSRWVPWELGLADGHRMPSNVAILPTVIKGNHKWTEQEYLGLYRRIAYGRLQGHPEEVFMVWDHNRDTASELGAWLRN